LSVTCGAGAACCEAWRLQRLLRPITSVIVAGICRAGSQAPDMWRFRTSFRKEVCGAALQISSVR
jgi:hypothetical protein